MPNILIDPKSGFLEFNTGSASGSAFNASLSGAARFIFRNSGELNLTTLGTGVADKFTVDGSNGRLLTVNNTVTGSIFSVNDVAGLPIVEVFSNDRVVMGQYATDALVVSGSNVTFGKLPTVSGNPVMTGSSALESDTLQTVTDRGATTTNTLSLNDGVSVTDSVHPVDINRTDGASALIQLRTQGGIRGYLGAKSTDAFNVWNANPHRLFTILTGGNVGIGTASPADTLQVAGQVRIDGSTTDGLTITSSAGASRGLEIYNNSSSDTASIINYYDGPLVLGQNNTEVMRLHSNGNVGIGSNSPDANLDVTTTANQQHLKIQGGYAEGVGALAIIKTTANGNALNVESASTSSSREIFEVKNGNGAIFDILGNGCVGIGSAVPSSKLEVSGSISNSIASFRHGHDGIELTTRSSNGRQQIDFLGTNTSSINAKGSLFINYDTDDNGSNDNIRFTRNGADEAGTLDMIIKEGQVGIGTDAPQKNLDIQGQFMVRPTSNTTVGRVLIASTASDSHIEIKDASSNNKVFLNSDGVSYFNGGDVGIGTDNPAKQLTLNAAEPFLRLEENSSGGNKRLDLFVSQSTGVIAANQSAQTMMFQTVGTTKMTIQPGGNVGIGSTNPTSPLTFNAAAVGLAGGGVAVTEMTKTIATTTIGVKLGFTGGQNSNNNIIGGISMGNFGEEYAGMYAIDGGSSASTHLALFAGTAGGTNEVIRINSDRTVGIGTTNPSAFNSEGRNLVVGSGVGAQGMSIFAGTSSSASIYFADGTAGSEAYQGWVQYRHGDSRLDFGAAGGARMRMNGNGLLIAPNGGATSPSAELEIASSAATIRLTDSDLTNHYSEIEKAGVYTYLSSRANAADGGFIFFGGGTDTEFMRIDTSGKVGIGTDNPRAALHVEGAAQITGAAGWAGQDNQAGAIFMSRNGRGLLGAFSTNYARPLITANSNYVELGSAGTSLIYGSKIYAGSAASTVGTHNFYTSGTSLRMHIAKGGNVGIGTATPSGKLHIFDTGSPSGDIFNVDGSHGRLFNVSDETTGIIFSVNDAAGLPIVEVNSTSGWDKVSIGEFGTNALVVSGSKVGIGTDAPLGTTHIYTADAGAAIVTNASHDDLIIENNGNCGIQLSSPSSSYQYLAFGDTASANAGYVRYYHSDDSMVLRAGAVDTVTIKQSEFNVDGDVIIDTSTASKALYVTRLGNTNESLKINVDDSSAIFEVIQDENSAAYGNYHFKTDVNDNTTYYRYDVGGSEVMRLTASGLEIKGNQSADHPRIHFQASDNSKRFTIETDLDSTTTNDTLGFVGSFGESYKKDILFLRGNGNVGIGTNNPGEKLVMRSSNADCVLLLSASDSTTHNSTIKFGDNDSSSKGIIQYAHNGDSMRFTTDATEAVRIDSSQRVGIGTNSILGMLQVNGRALVEGPTVPSTITISDSGDASKAIRIGYEPTWDVGSIAASDYGAGWKNIVIAPIAGKVGIGTTSPHQPLSVKGTIVSYNSSYVQVAGMTNSSNHGRLYANNSAGVTNVLLDTNGVSYLKGGNVGIGLVEPQQELHVSGDIRLGGGGAGQRVEFARAGGTAIVGGIGWHTDSKFYVAGHPSVGPTAGNDVRVYGFGSDLHLGDSTNGDVVTVRCADGSTHFANRVRIGATGNVGIGGNELVTVSGGGSSTPSQTWTNRKNSALYLRNYNNANGEWQLQPYNGGNGGVIQLAPYGGNVTIGNTTASAKLDIRTDAGTAAIRAESSSGGYFLVDHGGRVGIQTHNPTYALHIDNNGNNSAANVLIDSTTTADASISFSHNGTFGVTIGTDESDGKKFKISSGDALGTNDRFVIDNQGKVGIGTNSPAALLSVGGGNSTPSLAGGTILTVDMTQGAGNYASMSILAGTAGRSSLFFGDSNAEQRGAFDYRHADDSLSISTAASEKIRITSAGDVGIGTDNPTEKLDVVGFIRMGNATANSTQKIARQVVRAYNTSHNDFMAFMGTANQTSNVVSYGGGSADQTCATELSFFTHTNVSTSTAGTKRARIDKSGNFSLGADKYLETHNTARAHIQAQGTSVDLSSSKISDATLLLGNEFGATNSSNMANAYGLAIGVNTNGRSLLQSRRFNSSTFFDMALQPYGGNVGIGTDAPGYKLEVNGSIVGSSKSFLIDHPTQTGKKLMHACIEGPENGVYFRGKSQDSGIQAPEYWSGLVHIDSMTVDVTPIGANQSIYVDRIEDNGDVYVGANTDEPLNYFYVVYGERKDIDKLEVVKDTPAPDTGIA